MLDNGFFPLPPGKLAALVTYLEHDLAGMCAEGLAEAMPLQRLDGVHVERYRALFTAVGQDWLWFSRLRLPLAELRHILAHPDVHAFALHADGQDVGLLELDLRKKARPELAFFGLAPSHVGKGLGRGLMQVALQKAKALGAKCLHVHTCSLDHPAALGFYIKSGFKPVGRALEIFDDPRLDGTLAKEAARWLPLLSSARTDAI